MNDELEKEFEEVARKAIAEAEAIECDLLEFAEGLKIIITELRSRLEMESEPDADDEDE